MKTETRIATLEGLVASFNIDFGNRLLAQQHTGDTLSFAHFVRVADALIGAEPRRAALHLAGLVALGVASATAHGSAHLSAHETLPPAQN